MILISSVHKHYSDNILNEVVVSGNQHGINLGLNFSPPKLKLGEIEIKGLNVFYPDKRCVYVEAFENCKLTDTKTQIKDLRIILSEFLIVLIVSGLLDKEASEVNGMVDAYFKFIKKESKQYASAKS